MSFLALIVITGALCATDPASRAPEADRLIEDSARTSYVFKTFLKDDSVTTVSEDGDVTLTGTVADEVHKGLAHDTVRSLPGVRSVDNRLVITGRIAARNSDSWLTQQVRKALEIHRSVNSAGTEVSVTDGIVLLGGEASSAAQRKLTAEYAADVGGVKGVTNNMTVAGKPADPIRQTLVKIDDSSITAQTRLSLLIHRSTCTVRIDIETFDGVVKVTGLARNADERGLVTKLVTDIHGVSAVVNHMAIKSE